MLLTSCALRRLRIDRHDSQKSSANLNIQYPTHCQTHSLSLAISRRMSRNFFFICLLFVCVIIYLCVLFACSLVVRSTITYFYVVIFISVVALALWLRPIVHHNVSLLFISSTSVYHYNRRPVLFLLAPNYKNNGHIAGRSLVQLLQPILCYHPLPC